MQCILTPYQDRSIKTKNSNELIFIFKNGGQTFDTKKSNEPFFLNHFILTFKLLHSSTVDIWQLSEYFDYMIKNRSWYTLRGRQ